MKDYGLLSVVYGKVRSTKDSLLNISESLRQLSVVVDCNKKQVGLNQFNLFYDCEEVTIGGYSQQYLGNQKVYINERLSFDSFAHEWLHGIDNILSKQLFNTDDWASEQNLESIENLLIGIRKENQDVIKKMKEDLVEKTFLFIDQIVERFDKVSAFTDPEGFKELINVEKEKIRNNSWDKDLFVEKAKQYQKEKTGCISYLCSEIELTQKLNHEKLNNSSFYEYAKIMDVNLHKNGVLDYEYSTTKLEMFARAFESYVDLRLSELGIKNIISDPSRSRYSPDKLETVEVKKEWETVLIKIREVFDTLLPCEKEVEKKSILDKMNSIREKSLKLEIKENKQTIKLGRTT